MADTRVDLVADLEALYESSQKRDTIIEMAKRGDFHDFKSPMTMPKVVLVSYLKDAGFDTVAKNAMSGAYNESPDEEDIREMKEWLKNERHRSKPDGRRGR